MMKVFSVRDRALDAFGQPIFSPSTGLAVRSFADEVNRVGSDFNKHPEDYDLYEVGEWDDSIGSLAGLTPPKMIQVGKDLLLKQA